MSRPNTSLTAMLFVALCAASLRAAAPSAPTLHDAAAKGDTAAVVKYLAAGGDPNARDDSGEPLLCAAVRHGRTEVARKLLAKGANPNAAGDFFGETPVALAAATQNHELIALLVKHGAKLDAGSGMRGTPPLLAAGADPETANEGGVKPLDLARRNEHEGVAALLAQASGASGHSRASE